MCSLVLYFVKQNKLTPNGETGGAPNTSGIVSGKAGICPIIPNRYFKYS